MVPLRAAEQSANLAFLRKYAQGLPGCGYRPCSREPPLVEAGGQHIHGFRRGLDYAFIHALQRARMRSVLSGPPVQTRILVPARGPKAVGGSMSLYRAGLKLAFFLPLGVAMPSSMAPGFTDVSSVFQPGLAAWCDPLIEPPSVSPRLQDLRT